MDEVRYVAAFTGLSSGGVFGSFFVATLPVIQWVSACVAILSGVVGIAWVVVQYKRSLKK